MGVIKENVQLPLLSLSTGLGVGKLGEQLIRDILEAPQSEYLMLLIPKTCLLLWTPSGLQFLGPAEPYMQKNILVSLCLSGGHAVYQPFEEKYKRIDCISFSYSTSAFGPLGAVEVSLGLHRPSPFPSLLFSYKLLVFIEQLFHSMLRALFHLIPQKPWRYVLLLTSLCNREDWGSNKLGNLPRIKQLVTSRARIQI